MDFNDFDATEVEPMGEFAPLPAGKYLMAITESEEKETKSGDGKYLSLKLEVLEGDSKGRIVFTNLNLKNKNETAVRIAKQELSSICRAVEVLKPRNSKDLHDKPMLCTLAIKPPKDGYDAQNTVKKYEAVSAQSNPTPPTDDEPPY